MNSCTNIIYIIDTRLAVGLCLMFSSLFSYNVFDFKARCVSIA